MLHRAEFPILEFDDSKTAKINPDIFADRQLGTDKLVITFFPEVMEKLKSRDAIRLERVIQGENPLEIYQFTDEPDVLIILGAIGCPACGGNLDMLSGMGIRKVMFCGGGGRLDPSIELGQIMLVDGAIRDDGFSYHYVEASRIIYADKKVSDRIAAYLEQNQVDYTRGLCWTCDAIFRETADRIALRREEGARIVEMEQSGCLAVAQYRGLDYGALIYGGDDCASEEWSGKKWRSCDGIRYDLVQLCKKLLREI